MAAPEMRSIGKDLTAGLRASGLRQSSFPAQPFQAPSSQSSHIAPADTQQELR